MKSNMSQSSSQFPWIVSPFTVEIAVLNLDSSLEEELIELLCDKGMENLFSSVDLLSFWSTVNSKYTNIGSAPMRALLPFPTTYLCELGFSTLVTLKYKKKESFECSCRYAGSSVDHCPTMGYTRKKAPGTSTALVFFPSYLNNRVLMRFNLYKGGLKFPFNIILCKFNTYSIAGGRGKAKERRRGPSSPKV